jgi:hypothetical protein
MQYAPRSSPFPVFPLFFSRFSRFPVFFDFPFFPFPVFFLKNGDDLCMHVIQQIFIVFSYSEPEIGNREPELAKICHVFLIFFSNNCPLSNIISNYSPPVCHRFVPIVTSSRTAANFMTYR